jgi:hypothetical protein
MELIVSALPAGSWVPSLAADEVASVAPSNGVLAALAHGVLRRAATIGPPRVEVAIVGALGARGRLALFKGYSCVGIFTLMEEVKRCSQNSRGCSECQEQRLERYHLGLDEVYFRVG